MTLTQQQKKEALERFSKLIESYSGHPDFINVVMDIIELHSAKNQDYATATDPFSNLRLCERGGLPAWKGVIVRLGDKYSRLLNALKGVLFHFEGVEDAFKDTATYSLIGLILYRESKREES